MTKTDNLRLWTRFADIDPKHTKPITGKAYKGTSPKPQYVIQLLTEMFGPVGEGFGWLVMADGFQPLGDETLHWCRINFWWREGDGACNSFEAYGQTKALMKTKNGLMMDEDAPKKSLTDAITKAASQIGIASNLFMGRWDDSRYVDEVNAEYRRAEREEAKATTPPKAEPPLSQQAAAPAPQRTARTVADEMIAALRATTTAAALDAIWKDKAFLADYQRLREKAPAQAERVDEASDLHRGGLADPAILGEHRVDVPVAFHG